MYQVNNSIAIQSQDQLDHLQQRFAGAQERMKEVPGFHSFRLLKREDGSQLVVETVFHSATDFINWTKSEAFARAHGGEKKSGQNPQPNLEHFEVLIG